MPLRHTTTTTKPIAPQKYEYKTVNELYKLNRPSGAKWCLYGVIKFRREITDNCMLLGICDPTSYGKGPMGASCLLYRQSFAGTIELPVQIEIGQIIRLHRMKVTPYRPESGCIQLKSSNYYSWLIFDGRDDTSYDPVAQSSFSYTFSNNDHDKIDLLRTWLLSFGDYTNLNKELDFQFDIPESTLFIDQSTQTGDTVTNGGGETIVVSRTTPEGSSEFFTATSDEDEPPNKRLRASQNSES